LTKKGENIFEHMINESFLSIERPYFDIDLSLYFLQYVDKKIAKRQLRGRILFLRRIKRDLHNIKKTTEPDKKHLGIILDHDLDLVEAEIKSITKLMDTLI
jgi:hypothetical protein